MIKTHLNIPNTTVNRDKIVSTVATHIVRECLTETEIRDLAIQYLEDTYEEASHSIGDLAKMVKATPIKPNNAQCYPEQALYHGGGKDNYYFFVRSESPEYATLEVKEEVR